MIDTILLDAGGVILDETEFEQARAKAAVETLSPIVPGYDLDSYWADVDDAVRCHTPHVYQYVLWKHCAGDLEAFELIRAEYNVLWKQHEPGLRLMAGMDRVLRDLATDFDLVIAAQYGKNLLDLLEKHDLIGLFLNTLTQDDFSITKPDPRYYEQILARSGRTAGQSIMVGDRIDKDVIPAKMLGMKTIRVRTGIHIRQEPRTPGEFPDADIRNVLEIPEAARRIASTG